MFIERAPTKKSLSRRRTIYGRGVNDATYMTNMYIKGKVYKCPYYVAWTTMISRCYSSDYIMIHPSYINCTVCDEWLAFSNFRSWMEKQDWKGKCLDKDILVPGNKVYSPSACLFVTARINGLMTHPKRNKGKHPTGVSFNKQSSKFSAQCKVLGKYVHLGLFKTVDEANKAYKEFKSNHVAEVAEENKDDQTLYNALLMHARLIADIDDKRT